MPDRVECCLDLFRRLHCRSRRSATCSRARAGTCPCPAWRCFLIVCACDRWRLRLPGSIGPDVRRQHGDALLIVLVRILCNLLERIDAAQAELTLIVPELCNRLAVACD